MLGKVSVPNRQILLGRQPAVSWTDHCAAALAAGTPTHQIELLRSNWGYAVGESLQHGRANCPDLWPHYRHGVYSSYADTMEERGATAPLVELLRVLEEKDREMRWDYNTVHGRAVRCLRQPTDAVEEASTNRKKRALSPTERTG